MSCARVRISCARLSKSCARVNLTNERSSFVFKKVQNTGKIQVKFANPISKYFVASYSWSDAVISTMQHVYLRHRKADILLVKLTRAHDILNRAHDLLSRAHEI